MLLSRRVLHGAAVGDAADRRDSPARRSFVLVLPAAGTPSGDVKALMSRMRVVLS